MRPLLRIHTHCQVAQKSQRTDLNLSKSMAAQMHRLTEEIKHENTTMYIANRRDSSKLNGCSPLQLHLGLIGLKPAIAYFAYTQSYTQS